MLVVVASYGRAVADLVRAEVRVRLRPHAEAERQLLRDVPAQVREYGLGLVVGDVEQIRAGPAIAFVNTAGVTPR